MILSPGDSDMKAFGFRDILFAIKARNDHIVSARISLGDSRIPLRKQYHSPQANKTAQLPYVKLRKTVRFFVLFLFYIFSRNLLTINGFYGKIIY